MSQPFRHALALASALGAILLPAAWADDHRASAVSLSPAYRQECGTCHVPYPPGMLPAASWQRLMNSLGRHFGSDASVDAGTARELTAWLAAHAGTFKRVREEPPQERITRTAWFVRKHDEVPAVAWQRAAVKSPANCTACHTQADQGDFNEHRVRIRR